MGDNVLSPVVDIIHWKSRLKYIREVKRMMLRTTPVISFDSLLSMFLDVVIYFLSAKLRSINFAKINHNVLLKMASLAYTIRRSSETLTNLWQFIVRTSVYYSW